MHASAAAALLRHLAGAAAAAAAAPRAARPLISLAAFRPLATSREYSAGARRGVGAAAGPVPRRAGAAAAAGARDVRARSRRRNIFLDPGAGPGPAPLDPDQPLSTLYDSSRFHDDDDEADFAAAGAAEEEAEAAAADDAAAATAAATRAGDLPPARHARVRSAEFVKSSPDVAACPPESFPEFAVIGRSNVGKSSLINLLTGRAALAAVSKTPGKTRLINHFIINKSWYLVDLPGYGFARASKEKVLEWNAFTREYFLERKSLAAVLLLVDASIPPTEIDLACADWLGEAGVAFTLVFTKVDKRRKGATGAGDNIAAFEAALAERCDALPPAVATSARSGAGKGALLGHIARLRGAWNAHAL
jgi:GTP-binding protein